MIYLLFGFGINCPAFCPMTEHYFKACMVSRELVTFLSGCFWVASNERHAGLKIVDKSFFPLLLSLTILNDNMNTCIYIRNYHTLNSQRALQRSTEHDWYHCMSLLSSISFHHRSQPALRQPQSNRLQKYMDS